MVNIIQAFFLRAPKAGIPNVERVVITHPVVINVLSECLIALQRPSTLRLGTLGYVHKNRKLAQYSGFFEYQICFQSHSLRRGGATALIIAGVSFPDVACLGRWGSERNAKIYLRKAEALLLQQN